MSVSDSSLAVRPLALVAALILPTSLVFAQQATQATDVAWSPREVLAKETYVRPPAEIERLVTAPRQKNVALSSQMQSPDRHAFIAVQNDGLPTVQEFGKPHYYFAGLQVDYKANRARALTTRGSDALTLVDAATGQSRTLDLPKGATASSPKWSPDSKQVAYIANFDDASRLYIADVTTGRSRAVTTAPLLATLVTDVDWTADGKSLVTVLVPTGRTAAPVRSAVETGPLVRMTSGAKNKTRTYASLLRDDFEKQGLEYYTTGQLAVVDAKSGVVKRIGAPAMIYAVDAAPDGQYFRVTLMQKPFSYIVQYGSFGQTDQLWDATGKMVTTLAKRPLRESDGGDDLGGPAVRAGGAAGDTARRDFGWLPDGKGIYFLQQAGAPAGRPDSTEVVGAGSGAPMGPRGARGPGGPARKDRLVAWMPPYDTSSRKTLFESDNRMSGVLFSDDAKMVFVAENVTGTGTVYAANLDEPTKHYTLWRMRGQTATVGGGRGLFGGGGGGRGGTGDDSVSFYQNPGMLMTTRGHAGGQVALLSPDGASAYLSGVRYDRNWQQTAPRGFVDRIDIKTAAKTPVFQSSADAYETVVGPVDAGFTKFVVSRESPKAVPDAWVRDGSGQQTQLTHNVDFTPEFTNLMRKRVAVTRPDGYRFFVNVTLPSNYQAGTRLPGMFWFYPYEYTDQAGYDRTLRTQNINQFPNAAPRTIEFLATQGYAVANFDPPIVGTAGRMNDNYISDLQANLLAVIDELDRQGFIDRQRLGLGGHSYGAFSTLNAMTHTTFFKAGIAGDGMYNRSLTPSGFQSERRDFWEAQKVYDEMSPFRYADKLSGALLMYHSIEDQNVGTDPISSIRMMHALQGLGKTASLYMYPYEDHGPATKETLLDQWARWTAWLDTYVKNPAPKKTTTTAATMQ